MAQDQNHQPQDQHLSDEFKTVQIEFDQAETIPTPDAVRIDTSKQLGFDSSQFDSMQPSATEKHGVGQQNIYDEDIDDDDIHEDEEDSNNNGDDDDMADDADDEEQYGLYLNISQNTFKTSNRILDDIKTDLLFLLSDGKGILRSKPIDYSHKIAELKHYPYELYFLNQDSEICPPIQHLPSRFEPEDKITIIRALIYSTSEPTLSRTKVYHAKILIKKKGITERIKVSKNEFHLVNELNEKDSIDLISSKSSYDTDDEKTKSSLPKIVDEANYICRFTNLILRIEISEPEFDHDDLHDFEIGPINVRYTKALETYPDLNQTTPPPSHCLNTLYKAIRGPLMLKADQEHRTIPKGNKNLNSHINPNILIKRLQFQIEGGEYSPPNISDLNDRQSLIVRESYIRKIMEIMLLGKKAFSQGLDNPFKNIHFTSSPNIVFRELGDLESLNHHELIRDENFINLSSQPFYSDNLIVSCYKTSVEYDPDNTPRYFDSLKSISSKRNTYTLSTYVSKLVSLDVVGQSDIDDAYKALSIEPSQAAQIDDDMLLTMYKNEVAIHPLDGKLRNALILLASQRKSQLLERYLTYEPLPLNQAYDILNIDSTVDDDVVSTAAIVKKVDSPNESQLVDRALLTVASERQSFSLLDQIENDNPSIYDPISYKDACEYLGIDEMANDFQVIIIFQAGNREIKSARNALRAISNHRKSKLIKSFLRTGLIDHNSLPAENWPVGLNNIGNTCYLNSLLQYYFSIKPLRDFILDFHDVFSGESVNKERRIGGRLVGNDEVERSFQFVYQLRDLFYEQIHSDKTRITPTKELAFLAFSSVQDKVEFEKVVRVPISSRSGKNQDDAIFIESTSTVDQIEIKETNGDADYDLIDLSESEAANEAEKNKVTDGQEDIIMIDNDENVQPKAEKVEESDADQFIEDVDAESYEPVELETGTKAAKISQGDMETAYEIGRQQDVTECIGNVLSQIEGALEPTGFDEDNEQQDIIKDFFFGNSLQRLVSLNDPKNIRTKPDRFSNLFVNITDKPRNIYDAFDKAYMGENVETDNGLCYRTDRITKLPLFLQVQIQRVYYDKDQQRIFKSIEPLPFPETIYMDRYLDTDDGEILKRRQDVEDWRQEIETLQERKNKLLTKNSQGVTFRDSLVSTKDWLKTMDFGKPETIDLLEKQVKKIDEELLGIFQKTAELEQKIDHHFDGFQKHGYNIFAIFIHRGEASYGHYWIYIKDKKNKMFRKYNDENVSEVSNSEVFNFEAGNTATPYFLGYVKEGHEDDVEPLCRVINSQT